MCGIKFYSKVVKAKYYLERFIGEDLQDIKTAFGTNNGDVD